MCDYMTEIVDEIIERANEGTGREEKHDHIRAILRDVCTKYGKVLIDNFEGGI